MRLYAHTNATEGQLVEHAWIMTYRLEAKDCATKHGKGHVVIRALSIAIPLYKSYRRRDDCMKYCRHRPCLTLKYIQYPDRTTELERFVGWMPFEGEGKG